MLSAITRDAAVSALPGALGEAPSACADVGVPPLGDPPLGARAGVPPGSAAASAAPLLLSPPADVAAPVVVTFVTHDAPGLAKLRASAAAARAALRVVYTRPFGPRHGWGPRLLALHAFVCQLSAQHGAADHDVLVMVDGFDVLIKRDLRFAAAEFRAVVAQAEAENTNRRGGDDGGAHSTSLCVLLSAETNCAPDPSLAPRFPPTCTPYPYPNAGTLMGHVGAFRRLLGAHLADFGVPMDDQAWWQARYLECVAAGRTSGGVSVLLDARARVFQCLWGATDHLERGAHGAWRNRITGTHPVIFHGNGGLNDFLFETYHEEGQSCDSEEVVTLAKTKMKLPEPSTPTK